MMDARTRRDPPSRVLSALRAFAGQKVKRLRRQRSPNCLDKLQSSERGPDLTGMHNIENSGEAEIGVKSAPTSCCARETD